MINVANVNKLKVKMNRTEREESVKNISEWSAVPPAVWNMRQHYINDQVRCTAAGQRVMYGQGIMGGVLPWPAHDHDVKMVIQIHLYTQT